MSAPPAPNFPNGPAGAFTIGGIACTVYMQDKEFALFERQPPEGPEATVTFKCRWLDRYTLVKALVGSVQYVGTTVVRTYPWAYYPSPNLWGYSISEIRGLGPYTDDQGWPQHQFALVTCQFKRPTFNIFGELVTDASGKPYTSTRIKASAEVFTPPKGALYFAGTGAMVEEASIGKTRVRFEVSMTRMQMPAYFLGTAAQYIGRVNTDPIVIGGYTFPMGTVLFAGQDTEFSADTLGSITQEITYTLLCNADYDWNMFMRSDGAWDYVTDRSDGTGNYPFPYADSGFWPSFFPDFP